MKLTVCVPYRNRKEHLDFFLPYMKEYLKGIEHEIIVVEQADNEPFNRGLLANIGFTHSKGELFCIHDVDMIPDKVIYETHTDVIHLASQASQFNYAMPYPNYFGGVTLFRREAFQKINGFCNLYKGWGAEDDDLLNRCNFHKLTISRSEQGTFKSLPHVKATEIRANIPNLRKNRETLSKWQKYLDSGLKDCKGLVKYNITTLIP